MKTIIKLNKQNYKTIDNTKTDPSNYKLISTEQILLNINTITKAVRDSNGGTKISFKNGIIDYMIVSQTLEQIEELIYN